jgi:uncharacterized protein YbaA (DUF1428 family)
MTYVDGYLIPVKEANKDAYRKMSELAAAVFIDHGAVHVVENWGDDVMRGTNTDFFMATNAEEGENIVFSWISWPSKDARNEGNKAAMADPRFEAMMATDVIDGKRMIYSGFQTIVDVKA